MILVIKHISIEGPGTIGTFFEKKGYGIKTVELERGEELPASLSEFDAVIILGGSMNVYEHMRHPYLEEENALIQQALKEEIPLLGICLGSQLLAKACGARVKRSPVSEHGWSMVELTEEGSLDPIFDGFDRLMIAFQWHEDMFDLPQEGMLLATDKDCPHQASRRNGGLRRPCSPGSKRKIGRAHV